MFYLNFFILFFILCHTGTSYDFPAGGSKKLRLFHIFKQA